ncbi:hypothetical protein PV327_002139 [Microctonus hyperodae]|uniref:Uncharacterized protein n=1 Tax=Microctonus hyperodae TaxID=165561 RepID=A0AA39FEY2_MICHY|nr:hypothetical protein PV327_002139 [Microctonus hyperodae]
MNPTQTVALLLLLTSTLLCVNGATIEFKGKKYPSDSKILLNNESGIFMQTENKNNVTDQIIVLPDQSNKVVTATVHTTVTVFINQNLQPTKKTPSAIEAKDMEESFVHPKDDDDNDELKISWPVKPQNISATTVASIELLNTTILNDTMKEDKNHTILPAKIFPDKPDKSITDFPLEVQRKFTHEKYFVGSDETNVTRISDSDVNIVPVTSTTIESLSMPTVQGTFSTLETREEIVKKHSDVEVLVNKNEKEKMPPGVIALISAIGFAAIAVFVYFSLIAWKRYQEYLHGHRELLVNDFDSNDINNFEL